LVAVSSLCPDPLENPQKVRKKRELKEGERWPGPKTSPPRFMTSLVSKMYKAVSISD